MAKEKVNYQEVYDLYQLCSETKDLREFCADYLTSSLKKHAFYNLLINNILYLCVT